LNTLKGVVSGTFPGVVTFPAVLFRHPPASNYCFAIVAPQNGPSVPRPGPLKSKR
jgi:hypothetical protein